MNNNRLTPRNSRWSAFKTHNLLIQSALWGLLCLVLTSTSLLGAKPGFGAISPASGATGVEPGAAISIVITNADSLVATQTLALRINGTNVTSASIITNAPGAVVIYFDPLPYWPFDTQVAVSVSGNDNASPPNLITNFWQFRTMGVIPVIPAAFAKPAGSGNTRGISVRTAQAGAGDNTTAWTEAQLRNDNPVISEGFENPQLVNYLGSGGVGNFGNDSPFPGLLNPNYFALEAVTYLQLARGICRLGVNSDDGFRVTTGIAPQDTSLVLGEFNGGRGVSDTLFDFFVVTNGLYPVRLTFEEGAGGYAVEWFVEDRTTKVRTLVNDTNSPVIGYRFLDPAINPITITHPPQNQQITEWRAASFSIEVVCAGMTNPASAIYQWKTNGVAVPGARKPAFTTPLLKLSENNLQVECAVTVLGFPAVTSPKAVVTVVPDLVSPVVESAATTYGSAILGLRFSEPLDTASVTNPANYQLSNQAEISSATLLPDGKTVAVGIKMYSYTNLWIAVNQVKDLAGNAVLVTTRTPVVVQNQFAQDVGTAGDPAEAGSTFTSLPGAYDMVGSGSDIWNNADHFQFVYQVKEGDFDVITRLEREDYHSTWGKAGLMVRENLTAGSPNLKIVANPTESQHAFYEIHVRGQQDASSGSWASLSNNAAAPGIPNAWMRLKRQTNTFMVYRSTNGTDWIQMGQTDLSLSNRAFVGLCLSSVNNAAGQSSVAWFRDYRDLVSNNEGAIARPDLAIRTAGETDWDATHSYHLMPFGRQVSRQTALPNATAIYQVKLANDGQLNETTTLKALESAESGWNLVYKLGTNNITSALLSASGFALTNFAPGSNLVFTLEVTPSLRPAGRSTKSATIQVFATPQSTVLRDSVQAVTEVIPTTQPDLQVSRDFDLNFSGQDIYNSDGAGQTKSLEVDPGSTALYLGMLQNDGNIPQSFKIKGPSGGTGWDISYFLAPPALQFNGSDTYVDLGAWSPGKQWTIEAWVKPAWSDTRRRSIAGAFAECRDWGITLINGQFATVIQPPGGCSDTVSSGEPVSNQWYHVAGVCDGTNAQIIINGDLKKTGRSAAYDGTAAGTRIGGEVCCGGNNFPGLISEVRIWNRPLDTNEIQAAMRQRLTGKEPGLVGYWLLDRFSGPLPDLTTNGHAGTLVNNPQLATGLAGVADGIDITTEVTGTGWTNITLNPFATAPLLIAVTPSTAAAGKAREILLTASALSDPAKVDAIKTVTTALAPSTVPVNASFTTDADFEKGRLVGLEYASVHNQLQLSREAVTLPFIWVPNSDEGNMSKVDTRTGRELGRYRTIPSGGSPSRTTVDQQGNCWIVNRTGGTAVKVGLLENGQYLDRNFNGTIETSQDLNDDGDITGAEMLPFGKDECVLFEVVFTPGYEGTYVPGTYTGPYNETAYPRSIAVDAQGNVWVGTYNTKKYYYISGSTGQILRTVDVSSVNHAPYGAVVDKNGILWSAGIDRNYVLRLDPADNSFRTIAIGHTVYGLALDNQDHLFISGWQSVKLSRLNILTGTLDWTRQGINESRGMAVTDDGDVWVANSQPGTVARWSNDGILKAQIPVGSTPTGVSIDAAGKVWVVNYGDEFIKRIEPATDQVDLSKRLIAGHHYGYSDMTGIISRNSTVRSGNWNVIHDARVQNTAWDKLTWNVVDATGTNITVRIRSSNDRTQWSAWEVARNGATLLLTPPGQYLEIEVAMRSTPDAAPPILQDIQAFGYAPAPADLALSQAPVPAQPLSEHPVTFKVTVQNLSPNWALAMTLTNVLPSGVELQSISIPIGYYQVDKGTVTCWLPGLKGNTSTTIAITVVPQQPGFFTNLARLAPSGNDPVSSNNESISVVQAWPTPCLAPPMGMAGWWPGDNSAQDLISGNAGLVRGSPSFTTNSSRLAFLFDSDDDQVTIPHQDSFNVNPPGFTVDFWMKGIKNQPASLFLVIEKSHGWVDSTGWAFQGDSATGRISLGIGSGGSGASNFAGVNSSTDVLDGRFHHVVGTWDGFAIRLYIDGRAESEKAFTTPANNNRTVNIGYTWGNNSPQRFFRGLVDEVGIYTRALSETEIAAIYDARSAGRCKDGLFVNFPKELPGAVVGREYAATFLAALGHPAYRYSITNAKLPPGLDLSAQGILGGVPTTAQDYPFTLQVQDARNQTAQKDYVLSVKACVPLVEE